MSWMDITVSMKSRRHWNNRTNVQLAFTEYGYDDEMEEQDESFILESKYDKVSGKNRIFVPMQYSVCILGQAIAGGESIVKSKSNVTLPVIL